MDKPRRSRISSLSNCHANRYQPGSVQGDAHAFSRNWGVAKR